MSDLRKIEVFDYLHNDFRYDWGVEAIKAPQVWDKTKGEGVKVAIIDTGIDMTHIDLVDNIRGKINMFERSHDVTDDHGHGTHVAGLIAGKRTGVAPEAELYIAKVLNNYGLGLMSSVMDGITFAINYEVDILCMSLGTKDLPLIVKERINQAYHCGITIVCATGNSSYVEPQYPAIMDQVIGVGGVDRDLELSWFSNYGEKMDIVAPSVEILSTYKDGNYAKMSGTSMASPLIAGSIALLISYYKKKGITLTPQEVKEKIQALGQHSYKRGYGLMDLTKLLAF